MIPSGLCNRPLVWSPQKLQSCIALDKSTARSLRCLWKIESRSYGLYLIPYKLDTMTTSPCTNPSTKVFCSWLSTGPLSRPSNHRPGMVPLTPQAMKTLVYLPLRKMMDFVSWDDYSELFPISWKAIKAMFQTTNQLFFSLFMRVTIGLSNSIGSDLWAAEGLTNVLA